MLRLPSELIKRMVFNETPHSFTLYNEQRLDLADRVVTGNDNKVPYYANNWEKDGQPLPRLAETLDHIKPIECMQDHCDYALCFETHDDEEFFEKVAKNFERHSARCPDTPLGLSLLVASFTNEMPFPYQMLKMLEIASHSTFGCHVLEMDYADQTRNVKVEYNEPLVIHVSAWGEALGTPSIRIPLLRADGCPFHAIALAATYPTMEGDAEIDRLEFEFIVQVEAGMPWSLLTHADFAPNRVADYVRRYGRRMTKLTDHRKPFK